jgi:hypothetical protein
MQVIKYRWDLPTGGPFFITHENNGFGRISIIDREIKMTVGEKRCIGYFSDGRYHTCPEARIIENGWHCNECRINDDFFLCIQCDGSGCANRKQRENCIETNFYVYLAGFGEKVKVGVSNEKRLMERWVEQGADFAAKISYLQSGENARKLEQEISRSLKIADRIHGEEKQKMLFSDPNITIMTLMKTVAKLRSNGFSHRLMQPEIFDLRPYYRLDQIVFEPVAIKVKTGMELSGRVVAVKGNVFVLRRGHEFFSVDSHKLIGRDIEFF